MTLKLNLFFLLMDLFTMLLYPFVFTYGILYHLAKAKIGDVPAATLPLNY